MLKHLVLYFLFFGISHCAVGQVGYKSTIYTSNEGLPSPHLTRVFQDSRDFLWISTSAGLSRYDGHSFTNYSLLDGLAGSHVFDVAEDGHGDLWIATTAGLYIYNGKRFRKIEYDFPEIRDVLPVNDTIWLATKYGLYAYIPGMYQVVLYTEKHGLISSRVSRLLLLKNGELLVGTNAGVSSYRNNKFSTYWRSSVPDFVMAMKEDKEGNVWICTLNDQLFYSRNGVIVAPSRKPMHANPPAYLILNDEGEMMVGYTKFIEIYKNGLLKERIDGIDAYRNTMFDGIQDREGNYWLATRVGLVALRKSVIKDYPTLVTEEKELYRIPGDTNIYFYNCEHFYTIQEDTLLPAFSSLPPMFGCAETFGKANGNFLFATRFGDIRLFNNGKYTQVSDEPVWSLQYIGNKTWMGGTNGILLFEHDSIRKFHLKTENGFAIKFVGMCAMPGKDHLLLTTQQGPFEFKDGSFRRLELFGLGKNLMVNDAEPLRDDVYLLATMGYGLLAVEFKHDSLRILKAINTRNGLGNDFVKKIIVDSGDVWILALNGIYKITDLLGKMQVDYIAPEDGMPKHAWTNTVMIMDGNGQVFVAGSEGLVRFPKNIRLRSPLVQRTYLTCITVGNEIFNWRLNDSLLSFTGIPESYDFRPEQNSFTFTFTGINLYKPTQVKYEFKLEGFSDQFTITKTPTIGYNDLPPGKYVFKVRSTANEFFSNEPYSEFKFSVGTPFWMTWWFRMAMVTVTALFIYSFYRWRLREQMNKQRMKLAMERELNESKILAFQARMNPHFIFNSLNAIQYFMINNDKVATLNYVSKFGKLLRQILDNTLNAKVNLEKEIEMLRSYIEMEELRFENQFSYTLRVADDLSPADVEIPGMIIQPFVENAIIHGLLHKKDKGTLCISFATNGKQIICTVRDNGVGRAASGQLNRQKTSTHQSHGTSIAINRLQLLSDPANGVEHKVTFTDLEEDGMPAGTKVTIEIPIV